MEPYRKYSYTTTERTEIEFVRYLSTRPHVYFHRILENVKPWGVPILYNEIYKYRHKEIFWKLDSKFVYLGFYQKFYYEKDYYEEYFHNNIDTVLIYEFLDPYTRITTKIPIYMAYLGLCIENTDDPPKMSKEMKNEIIYHPYHMFRNGDFVDFISEECKEYFQL